MNVFGVSVKARERILKIARGGEKAARLEMIKSGVPWAAQRAPGLLRRCESYIESYPSAMSWMWICGEAVLAGDLGLGWLEVDGKLVYGPVRALLRVGMGEWRYE